MTKKGSSLGQENCTEKAGAKASAAFMTAVTPNDSLAAVVGNKPVPRTEIIKKIWDYMKKNGIQDKANKRQINVDAKLKPVFGKDQVSMFDLAKIVGKHVK